MKGTLFLIPCDLGQLGSQHIAPDSISILHRTKYFIVERAKTARRFIKSTNPPYAISEIIVAELDKHKFNDINALLAPLDRGINIGVLSEAGCPGIADPGAMIARRAHELGIKVKPLVGPSSILLALMGSGLNGQSFTFHGYLNAKKDGLAEDLKRLDNLFFKKGNHTHIAIETPYRNKQFVETALKVLSGETYFTIACDLTLETEYLVTKKIKVWKKQNLPNLYKKPSVFCWL